MSEPLTKTEMQKRIASIFGVHPKYVWLDGDQPPWNTGFVENDDEYSNMTFTFDKLSQLAQLLEHKGINIAYFGAEPYYSEVTPGAPGNVELRFDPKFLATPEETRGGPDDNQG